MNPLARSIVDQALALNERAASAASNAFDWLFLREFLVKSGMTPYDVIFAGDLMNLRFYPLPGDNEITLADGSKMPVVRERKPVPLVLVPPLGVTTETFDLMPQRSLARFMAASGFHTYLVDWGKPERRHAHLSLKDYAHDMLGEAIARAREHSDSEEVSLMGWCMGGLLILMHAGIANDPKIRNIVTVASPIDLRGGGVVARSAMVLNTPAKLIRKYSNFKLHGLKPDWLHAPGWMTTLSFKMTDPVGSVTTYWDLLTRLWDREFVESHTTTSDYLNNMLLYPGGVIQDMVVKMAVDNKLAEGEIELGDQVARLSNITADFLAFAGESDILVPPEIAHRSVELVSSKNKEFIIAPGGHMGVILGSKAEKAVWKITADWLQRRSDGKGRKRTESEADRAVRRALQQKTAEDITV